VAAYCGHSSVVSALLRNGASVAMLDAMEETAVHKAATKGHYEVLQALLQANTRKEILDHQNVLGSTALHQAMEKGNEACSRILMSVGASRNIEDHFGYVPVFQPKNYFNF